LYGLSSGAVLALKAAARLGPSKVAKLALYEPPLELDEAAKPAFAEYTKRMADLLAANKRGDAVVFFLSDIMPADAIEGLRQSPDWAVMEAVAPTLAYDNAVMGDGALPVPEARAATMPALVLDGDASFDFMQATSDALAKLMPNARRQTLAGQMHQPSPQTLAPVLCDFFSSGAVPR
jgi:pimeloyl-ACP methyl ester carboxylesterase